MANSRLTKDILIGFERIEKAIKTEKGRITKDYSKEKITLSEMTNQILLMDMIIVFLKSQKKLNLLEFADMITSNYTEIPHSNYVSSEFDAKHLLSSIKKGIEKGLE